MQEWLQHLQMIHWKLHREEHSYCACTVVRFYRNYYGTVFLNNTAQYYYVLAILLTPYNTNELPHNIDSFPRNIAGFYCNSIARTIIACPRNITFKGFLYMTVTTQYWYVSSQCCWVLLQYYCVSLQYYCYIDAFPRTNDVFYHNINAFPKGSSTGYTQRDCHSTVWISMGNWKPKDVLEVI